MDHRMPITVHFGDGANIFHSTNVAYRGVFLETPDPAPLNKLVKLTADLDEATVEFLAIVARRLNVFDAKEQQCEPGMGLAIFSIGDTDADVWEAFVKKLYHMDPEAKRELEVKQLTKLHYIVKNGPDLNDMVQTVREHNYFDYSSLVKLELGSKHLLTITHASDHSVRVSLLIEVQQHPAHEKNPHRYRLAVLNTPSEVKDLLKVLDIRHKTTD